VDAEGPVFAGAVLPVRELTRRYAAWALQQLGGHRTRTAQRLGIDMKTLAKWLGEAESMDRAAPHRRRRGAGVA
jgi:two-component system response regulator HydG